MVGLCKGKAYERTDDEMKKPSAILLCFALLAAAVQATAVGGEEGAAEAEAARFSQMYFAPMDGANFFRLYAPGTGMVEFRRNWQTGGIDGAGGWSVVETNGDVTVREPGSSAAYTFRKGRPFSMISSDGRRIGMDFDKERVVLGKIPPMWEGAREEALAVASQKWLGTGRLSLFYVNPNHAAMLLAELALLGLFAFLFCRKWFLVIGGISVFAASAYFLLKTDGRGGFFALAVGAALLVFLGLCRRSSRIRSTLALALVVAAVVAFFAGSGLGGRFSVKSIYDPSTNVRLEKWRQVPRMMFESPLGWGQTPAGCAYSDWYQPLSSGAVTPTLDSDHLTYMTGFGWVGRFAWAFLWLAALLSLFRFFLGGGSALALAQISALGVAAMFNPLLHVWSLWIVPLASLWPFAASRPWKAAGRYAVPAVIAVVASLVICVAFWRAGCEPSRLAVPSVSTDGKRVFIGSREPEVWVVDDRYSIGWLFAPKEIRYFYSAYPRAKPLGYVQRVSDVPKRVRRLAVAGKFCREYIKLWKAGKAPVADELIFLSPCMPIDAIPERLRGSCRFAMVVGEFAVRYAEVYGLLDGRDGVVVIKGAEAYLPGWVGLILTM